MKKKGKTARVCTGAPAGGSAAPTLVVGSAGGEGDFWALAEPFRAAKERLVAEQE